MPPEQLRSIISGLPQPPYPVLHRRFSRHIPHLKTYNPLAVRDIVSQLSEAEIAGDISLVRSILLKLCNRSLLPAKVFIFTEDVRPGYFGTWTRNSRIIGPRTPFAKDVLVFDYSYDSGEEWEEESAGEADDVVEDGEDEDVDGSDPDSDLDSWLVDDDDEPEVSLEDIRDSSPPLISAFPQTTKRKAEEGEKKLSKKRKVVVPLVPFARGPCWESSIGQCDHDLLKPYRIQMFNGTVTYFNLH
jgi:chromatin assembly factor 1 subunit A